VKPIEQIIIAHYTPTQISLNRVLQCLQPDERVTLMQLIGTFSAHQGRLGALLPQAHLLYHLMVLAAIHFLFILSPPHHFE
jgi:hypothetical protein